MIQEFFTGSYGLKGEEGIVRFRLDTEKKTLERLYGFSGIHHPSYLCLNREKQVLYAVQEQVPEGYVHGLSVTAAGLEPGTTLSSKGADPCHLSMSADGSWLYGANYTSGSLAACRLDEEGMPESLCGFRQHEGHGPNPARQEGPHVHFSMEREGLLYVTDLGLDQVFVYRQEPDGALADSGMRLSLPAGFGPRHLEACKDRFYVLCELAGAVVEFQKTENGYQRLSILSTLPRGFIGGNISAAIKRSGNLLFASNRGDDSIAVFRILADGSLERTGIFPSGGKTPRDIAIFENLLVAANQDSDSLTILEIDREKGTLFAPVAGAALVRPSCICKC